MKYFLIFSLICFSLQARKPLPSQRYELLSGGKKSQNGSAAWDKKYSKNKYVFGKAPEKFLAENYRHIPRESKVLDVGVGEGRHAVFLAQKGYKVVGIDISSVALKKSKQLARELGVRIDTIQGDVGTYGFKPGTFDAIINFYYVDRPLIKKLITMLKPGGILIYEAYTTHQLKKKGYEHHNRSYLVRPGELLGLFPGMKVLKYEEPLHEDKFRASIILKKE